MIQLDGEGGDRVVVGGVLLLDPSDGILRIGNLVWEDGLVDGCDGCREAELQNLVAYVGSDGFSDKGAIGRIMCGRSSGGQSGLEGMVEDLGLSVSKGEPDIVGSMKGGQLARLIVSIVDGHGCLW